MIGIVIAMESELNPYLKKIPLFEKETFGGKDFYRMKIGKQEVVLVYSGIGKVNASYATTLLCVRYQPDYLVSTGVSGGLGRSNLLESVVATKTCQHDSDTTALGDPIGLVSTVNKIYFDTDTALTEKFANIMHAKKGVCACGDQFIASKEKVDFIVKNFDAVACDMESGAIGQVAYMANVPFVCIRSVSDGAGEGAELSFVQVAEKAAEILSQAVIEVLETL